MMSQSPTNCGTKNIMGACVEQNTEAEIEHHKPIAQGTSAYTGGGADKSSNL